MNVLIHNMPHQEASGSLQDQVLSIFKQNPTEEISNDFLIRNLDDINKNTIYGSLARLKEAKKIIWVKPGVHILNPEVESPVTAGEDIISRDTHERILKKYIKLRNTVEEFIFHVSYNVLKQLPVDMEEVSNEDRNVVAQMVLQTMEFTIDLKMDEQEKQWLKDL